MKTTQIQTLQKHLDEINKTMSDIKEEINLMETAMDTNDLSELFSVMSSVHRFINLPHKIIPLLPKFIPGKIHQEELCRLFGALPPSSLATEKNGYSMKTTKKSPEAGSSPPVKQLLDEPETVTTINTTGYELDNVACLSDEEIWTSGNDSTMKLYSMNQGSLLKSITTKSGKWPSDIVVTKSGDLVYTDTVERTVNIMKNEKIEEVIRLQNWGPSGVCSTSSGDLLVIMDNDDCKTKVVCYSGSTEKHTILFDDEDQDGQFLRYIDCGLRFPWGLCTDTNDNLFVAQYTKKQ
ncbi:uncharacterized protein LOC134257034, partial [Saccostrea cucullata]|uniref:uncharacterized protein LOC134257034 n=1 Tax=Saccostrea cuccullata TaxID=36930 RepID=UPI002ED5CDB6